MQPALTRASSQVREESLPFFYGPNKIYFETATFYPDSEADTLHTRNDSKGPKGWWRGIGDTNLRLVKHLHIIDRKSPTSSPTVELEIDRTGALGVVRLFEHRSLRSSDVIDASNSTPETAECAQQLRVDGPFVRGIEMALVHRRALGIITADWPSMLSRPKGIRRVSRALGGDVGVYSPETTNDRTPKQSGVAHGVRRARKKAVTLAQA